MKINPNKIEFYIPAEIVSKDYGHPRRLRGLEVFNNQILNHKKWLFDEPKIKYCFRHFAEGVAWADLPVEKQPSERYLQLDNIFLEAKKCGFLKDMPGNNILIHLVNGVPYFAGGGYHRLAIALILGLKEIPVDISLICTTKGGECES